MGGRNTGNIERQPTPIEWFVQAGATKIGLTDRAIDKRCRWVLSRMCQWATSRGLPLDWEVILDPDTVEHFCQVEFVAGHSRATYRADLRRMGPLLTRKAPWRPPPSAMATRQVALPYGRHEIPHLIDDARHQATDGRRQAAWAFLALGLGAGLDGRWIPQVTPDDICTHDGLVKVQVGEPAPRTVVVRGEWEDEVLDCAERARGQGYLIGGTKHRNRVSEISRRLAAPVGHPRLCVPRLRSTWLLWHLEEGTRLDVLCAAAGLKGFTVFPDLMAFMTPVTIGQAGASLRGMK